MKIFFISLMLISSSFGQTQNNDLIISVNGEKSKSISLFEIKKLKTEPIEFFNHKSRRTENLRGTPFIPLVSSQFPEALPKTVEVEFISINGFKNYFPMESFFKVDAFLTYEALEGKFERYSAKEKTLVPLGPYYLVWNFKTIGKEDKYQYSSVYQVKAINLITDVVDFGVHKIKNNEKVTLGYRTYKRYCLSCHAIGTWGGNLSVDLVKKKMLKTKGVDFVKKYALNPSAINVQTKMLALPKYKNQESMAQGIVEFLDFAENPDSYMDIKKMDSDKVRYESLKSILREMGKH